MPCAKHHLIYSTNLLLFPLWCWDKETNFFKEMGRPNKSFHSYAGRGHKGTLPHNNRNENWDTEWTNSQPKASVESSVCLSVCFSISREEGGEWTSVFPTQSKNTFLCRVAGRAPGPMPHQENGIFKRSLFLGSGFSHVRYRSLASLLLETTWCHPVCDRLLLSLCQEWRLRMDTFHTLSTEKKEGHFQCYSAWTWYPAASHHCLSFSNNLHAKCL